MIISLVFILIVAGTSNPSDLNPFGNKYFEIILDRFELVFENTSILQSYIKITRVKRDRVVNGKIYFFVPFGNNVNIEVKSLKKQGGEYRYMPYGFPRTPLCDALKNDEYVYPDVVRGSNFPADLENNCPFLGNYTVYNVTSDLRNLPSITRFVQSGDYCVELIYDMDGQHVGTYKFCGTVNNV